MSIVSELNRLLQAKSDLATSIANKGVTVPAATTIDGYAALVDQIQTGGSSLPYDAELEYLESTGTQYINLDFGFDKTDVIFTEFAVLSTSNDKYINSPIQWNNNKNRFGMGVNQGSYCAAYGNTVTGNTILTPNISNDQKIHSWIYENYTFTVADLNTRINVSNITFGTTTAKLRLFYGYNSNTSARIASYKHIKNGSVVINLIAVRKDGVGYMYDKVSGELLGNDGTGSFTLGPDVT